MATYLADRVIVFTGTPAVESYAGKPEGLLSGMNAFLKSLQVYVFCMRKMKSRPRCEGVGWAGLGVVWTLPVL